MDAYCTHGLKLIERDVGAWKRFEEAREFATAKAGKVDLERLKKAVGAVAQADAELEGLVLEDRAEIVRRPALERVVVPPLPTDGSGHRRDIQKSWKGIDGTPLPIVARGDVAAHRAALVSQWPHAAALIDVVLTDLATREEVRFRPTLFLGPAGSGKSSLARAICDQVGLPCELYNLAGMADSSLGGTSAQWSTAREAVPLQLIKRSKMASVAVVWDEVEKADDGKNNGSAMDALLPLLEIDQARRFRDLTLEVECDLSMVSHFATANALQGIPAPLRDRMRILTMPTPGWQHLPTLTRQIVGRLARDRGLDARWFAPLAEDELDLVKASWPGGSIRQLTRIVTTLVDGRDQIMGRC
nr:AAA family ATPase [Devosia sp. MC521]